MTDEESSDEFKVPFRLELLRSLELTPRRSELRRLAAAGRDLIEHLVSTAATTEQLADAADRLEAVATVFRELPSGQTYEGFAESANAGPAVTERRRAIVEGDFDAEQFAFFDHSPFIGLANPMSPPIVFDYDERSVTGSVNFGSAYEGPPGCVHGGYVAAAFDELLGATQSLSGSQGMTARLIVNYRAPTPLKTDLTMVGTLAERDGRKLFCEGQLFAGDSLCAEAEALFISFDPERFAALLSQRESRLDADDASSG
jgi:acyl-coenzyme A thioesterase PaaI-like protein